jgi:hypothetical protein
MIKMTWILVFIAVIGACNVKKSTVLSSDNQNIHTDSSSAASIVKEYTVKGVLTSTSTYCGGAAPDPAYERELHTPRPYRCWVYVRKGHVNKEKDPIIDSAFCDSTGTFELTLPPGKYVLVNHYQKDEQVMNSARKMDGQYLQVDHICLIGWFRSGLFQIEVVDKDITDLNYNFGDRCFVPYPIPCMSYMGPYPP